MPKKTPSREATTTVLDGAGAALICAGVAFIYWPASLILAGAALIVISWRASR